MDLTRLSNDDLLALKSGDVSKLSNEGLLALKASPQSSNPVGDFFSALGHHAMNLPHGGAQLIEHGLAYGANALTGDNPVTQYLNKTVSSDDAAMAKRESDYQAKTPDSVGSYAGATIGEIAPFLVSGGASDLLKAGGDTVSGGVTNAASKVLPQSVANVIGKVAGGATQGGLISAAAPVTSGNYADTKASQIKGGMALGGAIPLIGGAVSGIYNAGKNALAPIINPESAVGNAASNWAGNKAAQYAQELRNPQSFVPGSNPTTAQILADPSIVQAEKTIAGNPQFKPQFTDLENSNNLARIQQLNQVAGQPGQLDALTAQRSKTANDLYQTAFSNGIDESNLTPWIKGQVTQLLKRPAMQQAIGEAKTLASNEGIQLGDDTSVQGLHYAKMALDDQISRASRAGDDNAVRVLMNSKNKLLTVMDKLSHDYAAARQSFVEMSRPINSMEAGTSIINKLSGGGLNSSGVPQMTLPGYRSALASALKNAEFGMEPDKEAALRAIQDDLQRSTISNSIKSAGSDTAFNLQAPNWLGKQIYGTDFSGPTGLGKVLSGAAGAHFGGPAGFAGGYLGAGKLGSMASDRMNKALADALLHPEKFADLLDKANAPQATQVLLANPMIRALLEKSPQMSAYPVARQIGAAP